ncbi:MAG: acylneuraminate cytidylyltransferase family protein, partial [Bacteroidota bacterium]
VRYAIEAALSSKLLTKIVVSSDDEDILNITDTYENIIALRRPDEISGDKAPAITYVHHALENLEASFDYIVIVQPSSPFTLGEDIDHTIRLLLDSEQADSSVSIMKLDHAIHPVKLKVLEDKKLNPFLEEENGRMAAHELPELYVRNCSVYVASLNNIKANKIIGEHCLGYVMPRERSLDINDPVDFAFAEFLMEKNRRTVIG